METISKIILKSRKSKGYSQEELAELSNVNLRTIQRIENKENEPRGKTLQLICEALNLDIEELTGNNKEKKDGISIVANIFFLIVLNLILAFAVGLLTLGSASSLEIRTGTVLLSFFIPFFVVWKTQNMTGIERVAKLGSGYIFYILFTAFVIPFSTGIVTLLYPCLFICLSVLFYGKEILGMLESKN